MTDGILNFQKFDPFLLEDDEDSLKTINQTTITIHVRKRLANKYFTFVSGLNPEKNNEFMKLVKKKLSCNGAVVNDKKSGKDVIQFNGDHKDDIFDLLIDLKYADERQIRLRGI